MRLKELMNNVDCQIIGDENINIMGLKYDSREVAPGDLFFCIKGFAQDGHKFAPAALEKGAVCLVVTERLDLDVTQVLVADDRQAMAEISAAFYGYPAKELRMIGVTGTNGKTSITYFLKKILEKEGSKVGLLGTIVNMIGDKPIHTERTTPESLDLQKLLRQMRDQGVDTVVMEVSSHSLVLKRVHGIVFDGAVFTNLTQDHLDFHGTFENYAAAKAMLFAASKRSAINIDDPYGQYMEKAAAGEVVAYGTKGLGDMNALNIQMTVEGSRFILQAKGTKIPIVVHIPGMFSVYNALAAISISLLLGVDLIAIKQGVEALENVPGRFQRLDVRSGDYALVLDYAHTPDSLESALKTVRGFAKGRVVCVFGCGGNRDNTKRPIMGEISGKLADLSIVTSDNPRFEEPGAIIEEILPGVKKSGGQYVVIENRRDAILYALEHAKKDDVILLAGKGHEDYQEIRGVKHPFDEKVVVEELLDQLGR